MPDQTLFDRLRDRALKFRAANSGNVVLTFALATVPIMGFVGSAVDYSRANSAKAAMQAAIDATGLMLSKNVSTMTQSQINQKATEYFQALFNRPEVTNVVVTPTYTTSNGYQVVVEASGVVPTTFMKIAGFSQLNINATSTVKWGNTRLRVALVLDVTGSMSSAGKMDALKTATKNLLTQLQGAAAQPADVYVSIIPFSKNVKFDPVNYTQPWVRWDLWEAEPVFTKPSNWDQLGPGSDCPWSNNSNGFRCTSGPTNGSSRADEIPSSGTYAGYICPSKDNGNKNALKAEVYYNGCYTSVLNPKTVSSGSNASCSGYNNCSCSGSGSNKVCKQTAYDHPWVPNARSTWTGCVTDRDQAYDTTNDPPDTATPATQFPAEQYALCATPIMGLTNNWTALTTKVNALSPDGNTNQAIGLQLGWQTLTSLPFTIPAKDANYQYKDAIILLTDGLNTQNRWYTNQTSIDAREKITCDNISKAKITLYTVQVNTGGDPISTLLKNCAGSWDPVANKTTYPDPDKTFVLTSASAIIDTFKDIATELTNLRVAK
jgi:Flp pilus assembly protein TadG